MNGEGRAKPKSPEEGEGVTTRVRKTCPDEDNRLKQHVKLKGEAITPRPFFMVFMFCFKLYNLISILFMRSDSEKE